MEGGVSMIRKYICHLLPRTSVAVLGLFLTITFALPTVPAAASQVYGFDSVEFIRPNPDEIPEYIKYWIQQNKWFQGTYRINYDGYTWLLVAWGEKPTGGYSVEVVDAQRLSPRDILFTVELSAPGPGDLVPQVITYPYDLILLEKTDANFQFKFNNALWRDLCLRSWQLVCLRPKLPLHQL